MFLCNHNRGRLQPFYLFNFFLACCACHTTLTSSLAGERGAAHVAATCRMGMSKWLLAAR